MWNVVRLVEGADLAQSSNLNIYKERPKTSYGRLLLADLVYIPSLLIRIAKTVRLGPSDISVIWGKVYSRRGSRAHPGSERGQHGRNRRGAGIGDDAAYLMLLAFLQGQAESVC
jgi:hypothetical protein